jgi:hypothetical protein
MTYGQKITFSLTLTGHFPETHKMAGGSAQPSTLKTPFPKCRLCWCFCLGWCSNFVGSESGQKQSVKLLQNMVYNTTQASPPQPHTVCKYYRVHRVVTTAFWRTFHHEGKISLAGKGGGCTPTPFHYIYSHQ